MKAGTQAWQEWVARAQARWGWFRAPTVSWDLTGNTAGKAWYRRGPNGHVELNAVYCLTHAEDMAEDTIPHELAHIAAFQCWKENCGHDARWRQIYAELTGRSAHRCHSYGTWKEAAQTLRRK